MSSCDPVRPVLYRVAEGEATPEEAMSVARHLPSCTACRILFARERRIAEMLEQELQDRPVGEDFAASVMQSLPDTPPPDPATRKRPGRRGIKLAGFLLAAGSTASLASQGLAGGLGRGASTSGLPTFDLDTSATGLAALAGLVRLALGAIGAAVDPLRAFSAEALPAAGWLSVGAGVLVAACGACAALFTVIAAGWFRHERTSRP